MIVIVSPSLRTDLLRLPEYGMGYQVASVTLSDGHVLVGVIINGSLFVERKEFSGSSLLPLFGNYEGLVAVAECYSARVVRAILTPRSHDSMRLVRKVYLANFSGAVINERSVKASAAKDSEDSYTDVGDVFKRFSAFVNDFRVTPVRGLSPGTFATTAADAANVTTGMDAVARYALENPAPANKVFTIAPPMNTKIKEGTVAPAHGQPGGGVEVIFVDGSPAGTVTGPAIIPER